MLAAFCKDAFDLLRSNQRPGRVMHGDVTSIRSQPAKTGAHRILAMFAARHHRSHFFPALLANDSFHLTMSILARDDNDLVDGIGALKCLDRVCDDRLAV